MPCSWIYIFLSACICIHSASSSPSSSSSSSSSTTVSYTEHCSSIVPESITTIPTNRNSAPYLSTPLFTGADRILGRKPVNQTYVYGRKSLTLRILPRYYETIASGIYKVEGFSYIQFPYRYDDDAPRNYSFGGSRARGSIRFSLNGFWSEISRTLCMVGSASWEDEGGKIINLDAVLKLKYASEDNPTIDTGVISGSLESTSSANDPGYFDPVSVFSFPALPNYNYSLASKEVGGRISSDFDVPRSQSLSLGSDKFCSVLMWRSTFWELEYAMECREHEHCSPLGSDVGLIGSSPRFLYLSPIECSDEERKLRYTATFQNISYADQRFSVSSTVIGEAVWDDMNNKLFGVACRLLDPTSHFGNAVGDCTMRLSLRLPSTLTIRNDAGIIGQFWSSKTVDDSGYFRKISVTSSEENGDVIFPGRRYEYTELDRVRKSCPVKKPKKKGNTYPDARSYNMRFDMFIKNSKDEEFARGYATSRSIGNDLYQGYSMIVSVEDVAAVADTENSSKASFINISYKIYIYPLYQFNSSWYPSLSWSMNLYQQVEIAAEGVYNAETGYLCMVGCRKLFQYSIDVSRDCEILVKFEFAPLNAKRGGLTKGSIRSTRAKTDPLYFDDLIIQSAAYYRETAKESIWRMDLEIALVLISNALVCIFVGLQIFHAKRNPEVPSLVSIVMLLILTLGHMIPLVLNSEAVFLEKKNTEKLDLSNGGRLEANGVTVRVISMVAFLLQIRLLQLVWTAKQSDSSKKSSWIAETKALALYILGGLLTLLLNSTRNRYVHQAVSSYGVDQKYSVWGNLRSYAGVILDGFLLPQILLNIFGGSAERALCHPFYIGTSAVRLVPHVYNQYRAHNYPMFDVKETYYYANPAADFYSTAWDIIISCGVFALAVIVFLQQRRGGRCILPQRFRGLEMYEEVLTMSED